MGRRKDLRSIFNHSVVYTISKTFLSIDNRRTHDAQDIHIPLYQTFISIIHTSLRSKHYPTRSFLLIIQHTSSDDTRGEQLTRKREEKTKYRSAQRHGEEKDNTDTSTARKRHATSGAKNDTATYPLLPWLDEDAPASGFDRASRRRRRPAAPVEGLSSARETLRCGGAGWSGGGRPAPCEREVDAIGGARGAAGRGAEADADRRAGGAVAGVQGFDGGNP